MFSERGTNGQLRWITANENPLSIARVCLAAIAALASYLIALCSGYLCRKPAYLMALLSTIDSPASPVSTAEYHILYVSAQQQNGSFAY